MKKLFALLMVFVLSVSAFSGCGKSNDAASDTGKKDTASPTKAAETPNGGNEVSKDPVYIDPNAANMKGSVSFYTAFAPENGTEALIKEFNEYYPNITVEANVYKNSGDGNVGLDTAMMAGNVDVILSFGVANTSDRWKNGLLKDLTDRMAADSLDLVKEWSTDAYTYNDRSYVFPSGGLSVYIAINLDKWEAAGLGDIPTEWTWDEYLEACRAMTERDANGNVLVYGGSDFNETTYWLQALRQTKGKNVFYNADGLSDFDNPLYVTSLQREVDAAKEGIWYSKATYLADSTKSRDLFLAGTNASTIESILTRYIVAGNPSFRIAYAPYPVNVKGETNYMAGVIPNSFVAVTENCKDEDAAYAFAKFCATYGNKYMYAAGHGATWTGVNADEILNVVFGSKEEAEKWVDTATFIEWVIATSKPAYSEDYIVAYSDIDLLLQEYNLYVLHGELTAQEAMAELKTYADEAIEEAK